uniref:Uncharacterized protein n=1 Tax=Anguilla anguilla TaxID=7936 RepID=A0A0E9PUM0_ANGAN
MNSNMSASPALMQMLTYLKHKKKINKNDVVHYLKRKNLTTNMSIQKGI